MAKSIQPLSLITLGRLLLSVCGAVTFATAAMAHDAGRLMGESSTATPAKAMAKARARTEATDAAKRRAGPVRSAPALPRPATLERCSWDRPGHRPYSGRVPAAVDRYTDLPGDVRARLKARMAEHDYDDMVEIRRDSIAGLRLYAPDIRDMHFAEGQVCRSVSRDRWTDAMVERGLVYCEADACILVPTVCRNVSRITRQPEKVLSNEVEVPPAALPGAPAAQQVLSTDPSAEPLGGPAANPISPVSFAPPTGGGPGIPYTPILIPPTQVTPIPEPGRAVLLGLGLLGLAAAQHVLRRRRQSS
ncbi:MHFG family PEP-CTERM protein [Aquariibacter albus]|uniref:MHFG family PEP-CTERM protein n=1 Tax=Aquariibacter albus TaxID=2759899 RepID=A0A839HL27_9BURK|nr:MHFG family PEP-CTERM protein [Aquariibacter albus]MBB1162883.1 MHFG family PEP-CTERM protein [Aquariibacter albus]